MKNDFFTQVYEITKKIPYGRVTTYGAIAQCLGTKQSSRLVGWALNSSHHFKEFIPAYRVVNRKGLLTGKHHFGGPTVMEQLLENEGVHILENKVVDFEKLFWDPMKELKLE